MILCNNLTKKFGEKNLFANFSLSLERGITAILGPFGCGKTTLLRLVARLDTPTSGYIVTICPVGMVFPDLRLISWLSAIDNIHLVSPILTHEKIIHTLHKLEIPSLHQAVSKLSNGKKQRVAVARGWLFPSPWLLLDEAFRSWDMGLKQRLFPFLRASWLKEKEYTLMVTHDLIEALMIADRLLIFSFPPLQIVEDQKISLSPQERNTISTNHPLFQKLREKMIHYFDPMSFINQPQT